MNIVSYDKAKLEKTVVALGKFEGLHKGHMLLIDTVKKIAQENNLKSVVLTVNIPSEKVINTAKERFEILEELGIDTAVECTFTKEFASLSPEEFISFLISKIDAKYIVVGEDFRFGCMRMGDYNTLLEFQEKYGYKAIILKKLKIDDREISSSYIRKLIEEGNMELVAEYMGRFYQLKGVVSRGKQLGRTIGFPTINMIIDNEKILPQNGVYESFIYIDEKPFKGITNIGKNPTVSDDSKLKVETHIIDYSGDLYDKLVTVMLKSRIRDEKKFNNVDELKNQLENDKASVLHQ